MAESNTTLKTFHEGANAAMEALKRIEAAGEANRQQSEGSPEELTDLRERQIEDVVRLALEDCGELPDFAKGFIATMAEYCEMHVWVGQPNLEKWKAQSAMTAEECATERAANIAVMEDDMRWAAQLS